MRELIEILGDKEDFRKFSLTVGQTGFFHHAENNDAVWAWTMRCQTIAGGLSLPFHPVLRKMIKEQARDSPSRISALAFSPISDMHEGLVKDVRLDPRRQLVATGDVKVVIGSGFGGLVEADLTAEYWMFFMFYPTFQAGHKGLLELGYNSINSAHGLDKTLAKKRFDREMELYMEEVVNEHAKPVAGVAKE